MELLEKIIIVGLVGTIITIMLKKQSNEFAIFSSIATGVIILTMIVGILNNVLNQIKILLSVSNMDISMISTVTKICGIGIISEYFTGIIKDAGEENIAKKIEIASKILIFAMTLPLIVKVIDNIWGLF